MALYLRLFHGRWDSGQKLTMWGSDGPIIGPFDSLHVVYLSALRLCRDADDFELELATHERFIVFDGVLYGDFELLTEPHGQTMTLEAALTRSTPTTRAPLKPLLEVLIDLVTEQRGAETARRLRVSLEDALRSPALRA